jgi:hypothetical protein
MLFSLLSSPSFAFEIKSRYATLIYKDEKQLLEFNKKALKNISYRGESVIFADEVTGKLDILIEEVILILVQSRPAQELKFKIMLLPSDADIQKIYSERYGKGDDYIAFYSPKDNTIFISADDLRPGVLAHELAHVIINSYFYNAPTKMIHEALAQFVEKHIDEEASRR